MKFSNLNSLNYHERIHMNAKPFMCAQNVHEWKINKFFIEIAKILEGFSFFI